MTVCSAEHDDGEHQWACQGWYRHPGPHFHVHGAWTLRWDDEDNAVWAYDIRKEMRKR